MIEIKSLSKQYEKDGLRHTVLEGLSLSVKPGEVVALMGPSGVGKTTVLNIVAGLDTDVSGKVLIGGNNIIEQSRRQLDAYRNSSIGFIFQEFNLLSHLSALENVILPLMFSAIPHGESVRMGKEALETVGLASKMHRMPSELSGGQKQRIAVARALINSPRIILADEPTANLDSRNEQAILDLIFSLTSKEQLMTLLSTHRRDIAERADKIVELTDQFLKTPGDEANFEEGKLYHHEEQDDEI